MEEKPETKQPQSVVSVDDEASDPGIGQCENTILRSNRWQRLLFKLQLDQKSNAHGLNRWSNDGLKCR